MKKVDAEDDEDTKDIKRRFKEMNKMMNKADGGNFNVFEFLMLSRWKAFMVFFALIIKCTQNYDLEIL